jgi:hypothetical protein
LNGDGLPTSGESSTQPSSAREVQSDHNVLLRHPPTQQVHSLPEELVAHQLKAFELAPTFFVRRLGGGTRPTLTLCVFDENGKRAPGTSFTQTRIQVYQPRQVSSHFRYEPVVHPSEGKPAR